MDIKLLDSDSNVITIVRDVIHPNAKFEAQWKDQFNATSWEAHIEVVSEESRLDKVRVRRNMLLTACDWTQMPDAPHDATTTLEWADYRQLLRDLPASFDVNAPVWHVDPSGKN